VNALLASTPISVDVDPVECLSFVTMSLNTVQTFVNVVGASATETLDVWTD